MRHQGPTGDHLTQGSITYSKRKNTTSTGHKGGGTRGGATPPRLSHRDHRQRTPRLTRPLVDAPRPPLTNDDHHCTNQTVSRGPGSPDHHHRWCPPRHPLPCSTSLVSSPKVAPDNHLFKKGCRTPTNGEPMRPHARRRGDRRLHDPHRAYR
jgi:hypothetical protein